MNSSTEDIKDMLLDESLLGLIFATNLFIGREPTSPDNCVTLFDTPGRPPQVTLDQVDDYFYPSIQVRVRNNSYVDGYTLCKNIRDVLHTRAQEVWNSTLYSVIYSSNEPTLLDWDENNRARFIINFEIQRREV